MQIVKESVHQLVLSRRGQAEANVLLGQPDRRFGGVFPQLGFGGTGHQRYFLHKLLPEPLHVMFGFAPYPSLSAIISEWAAFAQMLYFVLEIGQPRLYAGGISGSLLLDLGSLGQRALDFVGLFAK